MEYKSNEIVRQILSMALGVPIEKIFSIAYHPDHFWINDKRHTASLIERDAIHPWDDEETKKIKRTLPLSWIFITKYMDYFVYKAAYVPT